MNKIMLIIAALQYGVNCVYHPSQTPIKMGYCLTIETTLLAMGMMVMYQGEPIAVDIYR